MVFSNCHPAGCHNYLNVVSLGPKVTGYDPCYSPIDDLS